MKNIEQISQKIVTQEQLNLKLKAWKAAGDQIVFSNGCFDILHMGHVDYLSRAADFGQRLVVGLNSDDSVRRLKGDNRPINDQNARAFLLAALFFVDAVIFFDEDTPYNLINSIEPHVLVKGSDYQPEDIVGYDIVKAIGGRVETIELVPNLSTTRLIDLMKS